MTLCQSAGKWPNVQFSHCMKKKWFQGLKLMFSFSCRNYLMFVVIFRILGWIADVRKGGDHVKIGESNIDIRFNIYLPFFLRIDEKKRFF